MKRQPNYKAHLAQTTDIEVLRITALQGQVLNNKLHRRVQEHESVAAQWKKDKEILELDLTWLRKNYNNSEQRYSRICKRLQNLPFPLNWIVMRCVTKAAQET